MGTMINTGDDVVAFLEEQHQLVKALFDEVLSSAGEEREQSFYALRRLLAVHETAEEEIVHPAARRELPDGEAIVSARLAEENAAKQMLAELEMLDVDTLAFETKLRALKEAVVAHAEAEERLEFERLASVLDRRRLETMKKAVKIAEAIAPTRPHAGIESATGNMLVGPFASMVDRTRDIFAGKA